MAFSRVQTVSGSNTTTAATSSSRSISAPAAGSLIVTGISIDKDSGAITVPTGFTLLHDHVAADTSGAMAYKVSDGTETSVQWSWTTSRMHASWVVVYTAADTPTLDQKAENNSGTTAVTSISTGTTGTTATANELAIAMAGADSGASVLNGRSWTNSFTQIISDPDPASGAPAAVVAEKSLSSTGTVETTFSTTSAGDQMWATVATFREGTGGLSVSPDAIGLTLGTPAPQVDQATDPGAVGLTLGTPAPQIDQIVSPDAIGLTLGQPAPGFTIALTPDPIALALDLPAPVVSNGLVVAPDAIALALDLPAPTATADQQVTPDAVALTLGTPAPQVDQALAPDAVGITLGQPAPQVDQALAPAAIALTLGAVAPASVDQEVTPGALGITTGTPAPTVTSALQVTPDPIALTLANPGPVVSLGAAPAAGRPVVQYVIEILNSGATFGPNAKLGEVWDARNVGWSQYDRLPGKAFFTLRQNSPSVGLITPLTTHVRIYRLTATLTTLVFVGAIVDTDSTGDDIVVTCFDYTALLSVSRTGYRVMYPNKSIGTEIVSPEWTLAKNATSSPLGFVTTGTIENPTGTDGVTVIKTNNQFGLLDQMRLQLFFDLSEMGRANTVYHTTYEITRSTSPTFNFFKNKGSSVGLGLILNGNVSDYRHLPNWTSYRNDLATIGQTVGGGATEVVVKDDTAAAARGRRQDVFTIKSLLGIVGAATTADQQRAAAERVLKASLQVQPTLLLRMLRGSLDFFNGWDISDKAKVEIDNGIDSIATEWRILGARATFDDSGENPSLIVSPVVT